MVKINETLDSNSITQSKVDIRFLNGFAFSKGLRIGTGVFAIIGFFAILSGGVGFIIGPVLVIIGIYTNSSTYGTEISLENNYIKVYTTSFGIKKGKWIPTVLLPDITILKMGKAVSMNQVFGPGEVKIESTIYEICLMSANHRKRFLIKETKSHSEAIIQAEELAKKMGKNLVQFNPTISKATLAKRYDRH